MASTNEPLRQATADVFDSWITSAAERFARAGIPGGKARELAIALIAALEGAFVLSRAMRTTDACPEVAGAATTAAVRAAMAASARPRRGRPA